jgi:hypothetical protein
MTETHCLLIPANGEGLPELIHGKEINPAYILGNETNHAHTVTLNLMVDNQANGEVLMTVKDGQKFNDRAAAALVFLTGVHMVFTGPVIFTDLAPEQYAGILGMLS